MPATDLSKCKAEGEARGYYAFVVHKGYAYFRKQSTEDCISSLCEAPQSDTFVLTYVVQQADPDFSRSSRKRSTARKTTFFMPPYIQDIHDEVAVLRDEMGELRQSMKSDIGELCSTLKNISKYVGVKSGTP